MSDCGKRAQELFDRTVLSWNEAEVQALLEDGLSTDEIADRLQMAESTVEEFSQRISQKRKRARATLDELT